MLLDEPLVALDPETVADIRRVLRDQLVSITTVAVTHDAADAVALADRLLEHRNLCQQRYIPAYVVGCIVSIEGLY